MLFRKTFYTKNDQRLLLVAILKSHLFCAVVNKNIAPTFFTMEANPIWMTYLEQGSDMLLIHPTFSMTVWRGWKSAELQFVSRYRGNLLGGTAPKVQVRMCARKKPAKKPTKNLILFIVCILRYYLLWLKNVENSTSLYIHNIL